MLDHPAFQRDRLVVRGEGEVAIEPVADGASKPIDRLLALQRMSLFKKVPVDERVSLASVATEDTLTAGETVVLPGASPAMLVVLDGEITISADGQDEAVVVGSGDALGVFETFAGVPLGRTATVTRPGRALRISSEDLFDLLGQRPELLSHMFTTLFGARRAEWSLGTSDLNVRPEAGPSVWREAVAP